MKRFAFTALLLVLGCKNENLPTPQGRFEVRKITGDTVQFVPTQNQLTYCLIFTRSKSDGTLRQMTMSNENRSVHCPVGQPVMGQTFRIPTTEGAVTVLGIFSDSKLNAASIAQQLLESPDGSPMDLRAPGAVNTQAVVFTPSAETATPQPGAVVGANGLISSDGGVSQPISPQGGGKVTGTDGGLEKVNPHP